MSSTAPSPGRGCSFSSDKLRNLHNVFVYGSLLADDVVRVLLKRIHALKYYSPIFDAVHTPRMTRLLREAEECGAAIVLGLEMFIWQAYEPMKGSLGLPAPKELFRKTLAGN